MVKLWSKSVQRMPLILTPDQLVYPSFSKKKTLRVPEEAFVPATQQFDLHRLLQKGQKDRQRDRHLSVCPLPRISQQIHWGPDTPWHFLSTLPVSLSLWYVTVSHLGTQWALDNDVIVPVFHSRSCVLLPSPLSLKTTLKFKNRWNVWAQHLENAFHQIPSAATKQQLTLPGETYFW